VVTRGPEDARVALRAFEPTGVLVVRAWIEPGNGGGFRARITSTLDASSHEQTVTAVASADDAVRTIVDWLDEFARSAEVTKP
jgi:hypothetical protein